MPQNTSAFPPKKDASNSELVGWHRLVEGFPWFIGRGKYSIAAYSEYMPPPRLHLKPYGDIGIPVFDDADPYGWRITEMEEAYELHPGLEHLANSILSQPVRLGQGQPAPRIAGHKARNLTDNPYWPPELAAKAGQLTHERYVTLLPLALSRTQDDKGRIRWTLFGSSEQGPERAFWNSFYTAPDQEKPEREFTGFIQHLLAEVYNEKTSNSELYAHGFRILPSELDDHFPYWHVEPLPTWTCPYLIGEDASFEDVRYLLTFRPFSHLPAAARKRYLSGQLCLIPFPGSLLFWGIPSYIKLQKQLPMVIQAALLRAVEHRNAPNGIRVPQSGWLNEPKNERDLKVQPELVVNTYKRTSRWDRAYRWEDETAQMTHLGRVSQVLFSTAPNALGLYDKPMARNAQIWTEDSQLLLDGPHANHDQILHAAQVVDEGGNFRYRFIFPAMRVGQYEVYWHRPLAAYWLPSDSKDPYKLLSDAPLGYLTAYNPDTPDLAKPVELWPHVLNRPLYSAAIAHFDNWREDLYRHQTPMNIIRLLDSWHAWGERPLPRDFARQLLRLSKQESLDEWLDALPKRADDPDEGFKMQRSLAELLEQRTEPTAERTGLLTGLKARELPMPITFEQTEGRDFEAAYWNDIVNLAHGKYLTKDNADAAQDEATLQLLKGHRRRDLEELGNYLLQRHRQAIAASGLDGQAYVGELPFRWHTDFDFTLFGGWKNNQEGHAHERDLLVVIPGRDRSRTVIMADHYDTAYMEDEFSKDCARLAANGADDNFSATATLLQAAPVLLKLSKEGRLIHDVWLMHLTGEEFPADCMGARHLAQTMVERTLKLRLQSGEETDLSGVRVVGVYVLDMIAHNKESEQDIFQISPGRSVHSLHLAYQAHVANLLWNAWATEWNQNERRGMGHGKRSLNPHRIPDAALYPHLQGQVRTPDDPLSSLFNTDGQIFSDIGVPTVLFMENYDISRKGYHDTHDTVENIDLDYGAAVARIAIEAVARVAAAGVE